jgi:hypothetical protein
MQDEIPVVDALDREDGAGLEMYCQYCKDWHLHGRGDGHRWSHCWNDTPYRKTGYILRRVPKCGYWVSFDLAPNSIGTWTDYAPNTDVFITMLLNKKGKHIKRFIKLHLDERDGKSVWPPESIDVSKYNQWIGKKKGISK